MSEIVASIGCSTIYILNFSLVNNFSLKVLEGEQIRQKWEKLHKDRASWWDKQDKERKEKVTLKKCSYCLIELHWRGHYKHEEKCAKKAQPILDQIFGDQSIVDKSGELDSKKPQESGPVLGEFEIGKPTQNQNVIPMKGIQF